MKNKIPLSIVIPTIGSSQLDKTLENIFKSNVAPYEIIIVIPKTLKKKLKSIKNYRTKICKTFFSNKKNQVHQRILGFKKSKMKVVLQLDDDIILSRNCLYKLYNKIKNKNNIAIAPKYLLSQKKSKIYKKTNSYLLKVYHWLINSKKGYNPGTISLSGFNYADENKKKGIKEHEWLSGGIIIHKKKNLILKNYYPFNFKKSYCEDVLHSLLLREKKIKLMKYYEATVRDLTPGNIVEYDSFGKTLKNLYSEFLIRYYIVSKFSFSRIRLFIYYLIYFLRILLVKIRIWIK